MTQPTFTLPEGALHELPEDVRDFPLLGGTFGVPKLEELPREFHGVDLLGIKNQYNLDFCAGFASAEVSEDQEAVELDPHFPFMAAKRLIGPDAWKTWGCDLRSMAEAAVKVGFIEASQFPFVNDDRAGDRDFLANPENWPVELDILAEEHKKGSYWDASVGPYELVDNLKCSMFLNRYEHRSILSGALFRPEWAIKGNGMVPHVGEYGTKGEGHAFKVNGWVIKECPDHGPEERLEVVNSWGPEAGDNGLYYFPRDVVNKEFTYGAYTYKDMSKEEAQTKIDTKITVYDTPWQKLWKALVFWFTSHFTH